MLQMTQACRRYGGIHFSPGRFSWTAARAHGRWSKAQSYFDGTVKPQVRDETLMSEVPKNH